MVRPLGFVAALILIGAAPAWAQTPPPVGEGQEPPASTLEDVIVDAQTLEERAERFVDEVAQPVRQRGLARWAEPACFGVVNFQGDVARQIADQLVARADELGLSVGELECEPNVFIIGTVDAPAVAKAWVDRNPAVFVPRYSGGVARQSVLDNFTSSDAAVRWWHISLPVDYDIFTGETQPAVRIDDWIPFINVYSKSQQTARVRDDLQKVMVLVDIDRLGPVTTEQLCDYLLMVAYAQVDPEGDTSTYETVLNLFEDPSLSGLTEWDVAYLTSLYEYDSTRRAGVGAQGERLADELRRDGPRPAE